MWVELRSPARSRFLLLPGFLEAVAAAVKAVLLETQRWEQSAGLYAWLSLPASKHFDSTFFRQERVGAIVSQVALLFKSFTMLLGCSVVSALPEAPFPCVGQENGSFVALIPFWCQSTRSGYPACAVVWAEKRLPCSTMFSSKGENSKEKLRAGFRNRELHTPHCCCKSLKMLVISSMCTPMERLTNLSKVTGLQVKPHPRLL